MRTRTKRTAVAVAAVAATAMLWTGAAAANGDGQDCSSSASSRGFDDLNVIGYTADNRLICFGEDDPDEARDIGVVRGLTGDARLVGIDVRPSNSTLYGVGNAGGVYTIRTQDAVATKVAQLSVALNGTSFGVDVNPVPDALRIISDTGQNLRFSFAAGTTTPDTPLTYPPAPATATGVTGAAYTNNDADPNTATTLYDVDSALDQVAIQSPANSGQLVPTGKLGVDARPEVGFDIYSTIKRGTTTNVEGFASLSVGSRTRFYEINLFTGRVDEEGTFSSRNQVVDVAVPTGQL